MMLMSLFIISDSVQCSYQNCAVATLKRREIRVDLLNSILSFSTSFTSSTENFRRFNELEGCILEQYKKEYNRLLLVPY